MLRFNISDFCANYIIHRLIKHFIRKHHADISHQNKTETSPLCVLQTHPFLILSMVALKDLHAAISVKTKPKHMQTDKETTSIEVVSIPSGLNPLCYCCE